ncbi:GNAT family N-acetyltransferase [Elusimicrobiota bacterium]
MMAESGKIEVRVVDTFNGFLSLKDEWDKLVKNSTYPFFYCSHGWFKIVLEDLENEKPDICILTAVSEDEIIGIAPLMKHGSRMYGISVNKIEFIRNVYSPSCNFIIKKGISSSDSEDIIGEFLDFAINKTKNWDILEINSFPVENENYSFLKNSISGRRLIYTDIFHHGNHFLECNGLTAEEYTRSLSGVVLKNAPSKKMKRLIESGEIKCKHYINEDIKKHFAEYIKIYKKSWKPEETSIDFLKKLTDYSSSEAELCLSFVYMSNIPIAAQFWIIHDHIAYAQKVCFEEDCRYLSPGTWLTLEVIKYLMSNKNLIEIDFLKGDEPYKQYWMRSRRIRNIITVYNRSSIKGFLFYIFKDKILVWCKKRPVLYKIVKNGIKNRR